VKNIREELAQDLQPLDLQPLDLQSQSEFPPLRKETDELKDMTPEISCSPAPSAGLYELLSLSETPVTQVKATPEQTVAISPSLPFDDAAELEQEEPHNTGYDHSGDDDYECDDHDDEPTADEKNFDFKGIMIPFLVGLAPLGLRVLSDMQTNAAVPAAGFTPAAALFATMCPA